MTFSRRDLAVLLPVLAAAGSVVPQQPGAQKGKQTTKKGPPAVLRSKAWSYDDLKPAGTGVRPAVTFMDGITSRGQEMNIHLSELGPGMSPHPPHVHPHEELLIVVEGTMEVELSGKDGEFGHGQLTKLGPGSVAFMASNDPHGWRNIGTTRARYFVLLIADHA